MKNYILCFIVAAAQVFTGCSEKEHQDPADKGRIIVLMYHRITTGEAANIYERSVSDLEKDLIYLNNNEINVICLNDLVNIKAGGTMPVGHSAIITFDDGDNSGYSLALPLLKKYMMKATFFLWTEKIGQNSFLTSTEIGLMSNYMLPGGSRPFTFGSHSYSHQYLLERKNTFATDEEYNSFLDYELGESKRLIESWIPGDVTALALPFGDGAGDTEIIEAAQRNGYSIIRTSIHEAINDVNFTLFTIPALPILNNTQSQEIGYYLGIDL